MCQCKENLNGCGCGCNTCNKTTKKKKVNKPDQSNQANFIQQKSLAFGVWCLRDGQGRGGAEEAGPGLPII